MAELSYGVNAELVMVFLAVGVYACRNMEAICANSEAGVATTLIKYELMNAMFSHQRLCFKPLNLPVIFAPSGIGRTTPHEDPFFCLSHLDHTKPSRLPSTSG